MAQPSQNSQKASAARVLGRWVPALSMHSSPIAQFASSGASRGPVIGRQWQLLRTSPVTAVSAVVASSAGGARTEKPWAKTLIGGAVTIFFEMVGGHTMEFMKIDKQVTNLPYREILRKMTAQKGIAGCLDGFLPWGALQSAVKGAVFGWGQAQALTILNTFDFLSPQAATVLSGGCGGFVQGIIMSPCLLLKTRVMTDPRFRSTGGVLQTTIASGKLGREIVVKEGISVLTKGMGVFSFKRFCDWTTRYLFVELVADAIRGDSGEKLSTGMKVFSALAGGTLSALVTVPIDVMVATIQDAGKSGKQVSVLQTLRQQFASGGFMDTVRFSTRGLAARVAHVALTTLMMKTVTSFVYDQIFRG